MYEVNRRVSSTLCSPINTNICQMSHRFKSPGSAWERMTHMTHIQSNTDPWGVSVWIESSFDTPCTIRQKLYSVATNPIFLVDLSPYSNSSYDVQEDPFHHPHLTELCRRLRTPQSYIARPIPPVNSSASASASSVASGGGSIENTSIHPSSSGRFWVPSPALLSALSLGSRLCCARTLASYFTDCDL